MASGYDQFFKEAQKATGLASGKPSKQKKSTARPPAKQTPKSKFALRPDRADFGTPEDRLRKELANRMRDRKTRSRKRAKFPIVPAIGALIALILCAVAYHKSDELDEFLNKIEIGAFGVAGAAESDTSKADHAKAKPAAKGGKKEEKAAASEGGHAEKTADTPTAHDVAHEAADSHAAKATTGSYTTEEVSFFSKLNERKKELDLREADLNKLEEELQKRKAELDDKLKSLEDMRADISKTLKTRVASDQAKVGKLVDFYSTMKPQQAAKVIETLNEDLAIEILNNLKKKSAADILNAMSAKKARRLSELMTGYQRTTASAEAEDTDPADLPAVEAKPEPKPEPKAEAKAPAKAEPKKGK